MSAVSLDFALTKAKRMIVLARQSSQTKSNTDIVTSLAIHNSVSVYLVSFCLRRMYLFLKAIA